MTMFARFHQFIISHHTDQDTVSFGKGIFKDGSFHPPHTVTIRMNAGEQTPPQKTRTSVYTIHPATS